MNQARPAQIVIAAPDSLTDLFAAPGYLVQLVVTRTGKTSLKSDPGADPMPIDAPFGESERRRLGAMVVAHEVDRGSK